MTGRLQEDQGAPRGEPGEEGVRTFFFFFFQVFFFFFFLLTLLSSPSLKKSKIKTAD
jgi:hypothetical protein